MLLDKLVHSFDNILLQASPLGVIKPGEKFTYLEEVCMIDNVYFCMYVQDLGKAR